MSITAQRMLDPLFREIRLSVRSLSTRPGLVALCTITLALGLGSNAVIFSMVSALVLRPFPFEALDRLMLIREHRGGDATSLRQITPGDFVDIERETEGFSAWTAYRFKEQSLAGPGFPGTVRTLAVTPNFFRVVGMRASHGRVFETNGDERSVILSNGMWRHRLGARQDAVGSRVQLDGTTHTVVGIMPRNYSFPMGADVWVPLFLDAREREERERSSLFLLGLLEEGAGRDDGRTALAAVASRLASRYPETHRGRSFHLLPLRALQFQYTLPFLALLQLSALFVLLLATAILTGLAAGVAPAASLGIAFVGVSTIAVVEQWTRLPASSINL